MSDCSNGNDSGECVLFHLLGLPIFLHYCSQFINGGWSALTKMSATRNHGTNHSNSGAVAHHHGGSVSFSAQKWNNVQVGRFKWVVTLPAAPYITFVIQYKKQGIECAVEKECDIIIGKLDTMIGSRQSLASSFSPKRQQSKDIGVTRCRLVCKVYHHGTWYQIPEPLVPGSLDCILQSCMYIHTTFMAGRWCMIHWDTHYRYMIWNIFKSRIM